MYNAIETGSGLYILVYEIDETFDLMIGGSSPVSSPMYIRLVTKDNRDNYIDIRTEDVEKFIAENREEKTATETSELLCGYPKASVFVLTKTDIEQIALEHCKHNYDYIETTYDSDNKKWQVEFWENGAKLAAQRVTLDSDGNLLGTWFAE